MINGKHVTQWIECQIPSLRVEGSSPSMLVKLVLVNKVFYLTLDTV